MSQKFNDVFKVSKPLIAMLHLKGTSDEDVLARAKKEIAIYHENGVDAIVVENYFGNYYQMRQVLSYLKESDLDIVYGVNCLNLDALGFELAIEYDAKFVQLDSVVGHVKPRDEYSVEAFLDMYRNRCNALLFGGVRFKYQPVLSEKTVAEDLQTATNRCDAVVVTGNATGEVTDIEKIKEFRSHLQDFPLVVGAGITVENAKEQMKYCDAAIIGSYLKEGYKDTGEVDVAHVKQMVECFKELREELV